MRAYEEKNDERKKNRCSWPQVDGEFVLVDRGALALVPGDNHLHRYTPTVPLLTGSSALGGEVVPADRSRRRDLGCPC